MPITAPDVDDQGTWLGVLVHVMGLFLSIIGAGIIYLASSHGFDRKNAKNALHWHIFVFITWNVGWLVAFLGIFLESFGVLNPLTSLILVSLGAIGMMVLGISNFFACTIAAIKAFNGETWCYPISIKTV